MSPVLAQQEVPDGRFLEPETKVGAPVHYILKYSHSPTQEVLFPDSTYNFAPFELIEKQFFPTRTVGNTSIDSVVYILATYETDLRQGLALPIFVAAEGTPEGKRAIFPMADSIDLEPLIQTMPDSVALFEDTQMAYVAQEFNYPYLIIGIAVVMLATIVLVLLFGKTVRNNWKLRKLKKRHLQFSSKFDQYIGEGIKADVEVAIALWKSYTGKLIAQPLSSYTTKEITKLIAVPQVIDGLRYTDKVIYAGTASEDDLSSHLRQLKQYTQEAYEQEIQKIKRQ